MANNQRFDLTAIKQCTSAYEGWRCQLDAGHEAHNLKHRAGDGGLTSGATWWRRFIDFDVQITDTCPKVTEDGES